MIRIFLIFLAGRPTSGCAFFKARVSFAVLLLLILILQPSCYVAHYEIPSKNPMSQLEQQYSVYLDSTWTAEHAHALLKVFESISSNLNLQFSRWHISDEVLKNGIQIESKEKFTFVTISRNIFPVEEAEEVLSPGKHLYYAVFQFITENGTNRARIELIIQERYGIYIPSYTSLTEERTPQTAKRYSNFENDDLMLIISVFEEFPQVFHKIPQLKYIVRRIDIEDRGKSLAVIGGGRIEFAESTFNRHNFYSFKDTRRVIAHEKAHFLWAYVFHSGLKADWTQLAGWYRDANSESGWSTTQERSAFVSDYAFEENPNEDMAESIAYYLVDPDKLRSCCPEKYEFIHNRIMLTYGKQWDNSNLM